MNYFKGIITALFFILFLNCPTLQAQNFNWAKSIGGTGIDVGRSTYIDASGNVFSIGYFQNTVDFDPSTAISNLTSAGNYDVYIAKYDVNGNYLWAKNIGGKLNDYSSAITVDHNGNIYITGFFNDTADFDPSLTIANLVSSGGTDVFIAKYDSIGKFIWAKRLGGAFSDEAHTIILSGSHIFIAGGFQDVVDFDLSSAVANFNTNGGYDLFIAKYDTAANYIWAKTIGGVGNDYARNAYLASSGDIYFSGEFSNTVDFDPSATVVNISSAGATDVFIAKYDALGNYVWAGSFGGALSDNAGGLILDKAENVYATGYFLGTADLNPFSMTENFTSAGVGDIFITKITSSGTFLWSKAFGGSNNDIVYGISNDLSSIYLTGYFEGTSDFDPSSLTHNLTSVGLRDIFVARYDTAGNYIWAINPGGAGNDFGRDIKVNTNGNMYVTGYFDGVADFDFSASSATLTPKGSFDVFMAKYCQVPMTALAISGTDTVCGATNDLVYSLALPYATTYNWQVPNGANIISGNGTSTIVVNYSSSASSGNITVYGTNACGTGTSYSLPVVVNPVPPAPAAASNTPVCQNDSLKLTAGSVTGATYSWSGPNNFTSAIQNPAIENISPAAAGTYTVNVTVNGCMSPSGTVDVVVKPLPAVPTAFSNAPLCENATLNLTTNDLTGAIFTWKGPNGFSSNMQHAAITNVSLAATGTYSVTASLNGCTSAAGTLNVLVHPLPVPVLGSNSPVCENTALNLTAAPLSGGIYNWTGPNNFISSAQNPTIPNTALTAAGTYTLVVTANGCSGPAGTVNVVVNEAPSPAIASNSPICTGNNLSLTAAAVPGGVYSWSGPNAFSSSLQSPVRNNMSPADSGIYSLVVTANNCTGAVKTIGIKVKQTPLAPVAASNSPVCEKSGLNLTAATIPGASYSWTSSTGFTAVVQNPSISNVSLSSAGTYSVSATVDGCPGPAGTVSVTVTALPPAPVAGSNGTVCEGAVLNLTAGTINGATYSWTGPNGFTSTQQNPSISAVSTAATGTYTVTATVGKCTGPAATVVAAVKLCSGIAENNARTEILHIYPNPLSASANIVISAELLKQNKVLYFSVYDIVGREISTMRIQENNFIFDRNNLNKGVYSYQLKSESKIIKTGKIMIH